MIFTNHFLLNQSIFAELTNLLKDIYYSSFIKSEFVRFTLIQFLKSKICKKKILFDEQMYKNLIGLNKVNTSKANPGKISLKKKQLDAETRSENSILIEDYFGMGGTNSASVYNANDGDNEDEAEYYNSGEPGTGMFKYDDEDDEDYENFDMRREDLALGPNETLNVKVGSDIRLDLIDEINDEFVNDDVSPTSLVTDKTSASQTNLDKFSADLIRAYSQDEDEDDGDYYKDDSLNSASNQINLNNLQIAIDDIEELVDKSNNKTCCVFVIKVWNLEAKYGGGGRRMSQVSLENESLEKPSWIVKRKYDEFYVLDSRLKEFHGGLITSSEFNVKNPHKITVQLPTKQRALFFLNNTNNSEFLHSIKDDFAKYLQVKF